MDIWTYVVHNDLTMRQLAKKAGMSHTHLSRLVNGRVPWALKSARQIERATNGDVSAAWLLGLSKGDAMPTIPLQQDNVPHNVMEDGNE